MGARTAGRARVDDPGQGIQVQRQAVAVSVDDGAGLRETPAQQSVAVAGGDLMAVDHGQTAAGQGLIQPLREMDQQTPVFFRPFAGDVVVAEDRHDPAEPRLELGQDGGAADVPAVDRQIAAGDDLLDAGIERAVGVGQDGDTHLIQGREAVLEWFARVH